MPLGFAIVGAGRGASLARVLAARADCRVVAVCDVRAERAAAVAAQFPGAWASTRFEELLARPQIDALIIATPAPLHATQAIAALEAGKHVLSEVPALWTLEEGPALVAAARRSKAKYMLAENMAYFAWVQSFEALVRAGFIGTPVYAECEYVHDLRPRMMGSPGDAAVCADGRTWRGLMGPAQYCTHDLGPILRMFQDRVVTVVGMHTGSHILPGTGIIDAEVVLCRTQHGRVIKFLGSFANARKPAFHYFCLYGTRGVLESPRVPEEAFKLCSEMIPHAAGMNKLALGIEHPDLAGRVPGGGHGTCEWLMIEDFVRSIQDDRQPPIDVFTALDWSLPGLLGHVSAESGSQPLAVPDPRTW
jgi:predicted dehydrogenase